MKNIKKIVVVAILGILLITSISTIISGFEPAPLNTPPNTPIQPMGRTSCTLDTSYRYSTKTINPDEDRVQFCWDWGDGSEYTWTELRRTFTECCIDVNGDGDCGPPLAGVTTYHTWTTEGIFHVRVKAMDEYGLESNWSIPLTVSVSGINLPPEIPNKPNGPTVGVIGADYEYFTSTTDPNDDDVSYYWDWHGNNDDAERVYDDILQEWTGYWTGYYHSGDISYETHAWKKEGTYNLRIKTKDEFDHETEWSESLKVDIIGDHYPSVVGDISDRTINEGEEFMPILLDDIVDDPDTPDRLIIWKIYGNRRLIVDIDENRVARIKKPVAEWAGSEIITFRAQDAEGFWDETQATFTVIPDDGIPEDPSYPETWWNDEWTKRRLIILSGYPCGDASLIAINVSYDEDMQPDFDDLRFVRFNDVCTEFNYYIRAKSDGNWALVWIPLDDTSIINTVEHPIFWMYYGNINSAGKSSIDAVIDIFNSGLTKIWDSTADDVFRIRKATGVTVDSEHNIITCGSNTGHYYIVAKCDPNGNTLWTRKYALSGGDDGGHPTDVAVDSQNNIIVTGYFDDDLDEGEVWGGAEVEAGFDYWTIKISPDGEKLWDRTYGGKNGRRLSIYH